MKETQNKYIQEQNTMTIMENFIEKTSHLTEDEINEILYYYQQGIDIGKEETMVKIVNNMSNMSFDVETIAKIVNKTPNQINQYLL